MSAKIAYNHCSTNVELATCELSLRRTLELIRAGDISDASVFPEYTVPKMYLKLQYCVSCAIHGKIVRVRSREGKSISPRQTGHN